MPVPLQHKDSDRALARLAYETIEPLHVVAYFNTHLGTTMKEHGLSWPALYVGGRGGPLGPCAAPVVTAAFYNFSPTVTEPGWEEAKKFGLPAVVELHLSMVDRSLSEALGERATSPELATLVGRLQDVAQRLPIAGRPLAAAWQAFPAPEAPHMALWHATAVLREWRGDGHLATLVQAGLSPIEASVFHEANHPDPTLRRRGMGREAAQQSRGWSADAWKAAAEGLAERGVLTTSDDSEAYTEAGVALYADIETATDDAAAGAWIGVDDAEALIKETRGYVKNVIDAGILPGTKRKDS